MEMAWVGILVIILYGVVVVGLGIIGSQRKEIKHLKETIKKMGGKP